MTESEGNTILKRVFTQAGLLIQDAYALHGEGLAVTLDGFDPKRRVGYEFITTEAGDRAEVTPAIVEALDERMEKGELFVFLIDEADVSEEAALTKAAERFIEAIRARGALS